MAVVDGDSSEKWRVSHLLVKVRSMAGQKVNIYLVDEPFLGKYNGGFYFLLYVA